MTGTASGGESATETAHRHDRRGRHRRPLRRGPVALIAAGLVLVLGVGAWQLYATLWTTHSERVGHALVHHFLKNRALNAPVKAGSSIASGMAALAACSASDSAAGGRGSTSVHGLLEIPKIGVVAPVLQGVGDPQLAVAVGHDPYSVWPGVRGNSVLEAHDVSYFTSISQLKPGDVVRYVSPCTTYIFQVISHAIVTQGTPVYNTTDPSVTMVTCWPTDALWFTPDRYLVTATEVAKVTTGAWTASYHKASAAPSVPVPSTLVSQGVTLSTYDLPMATFRLAGNPSRAWAQSTSPRMVEESGVQAFIAGVRSLAEDRLDWWHMVAPGVAPPAPS